MLALLAGMILGGLSTEHWQLILSGDVRSFKKQELSLMGGIIAFLIASGLMIRKWQIPVKAIDYLILAVPLATAIGRIGCHLAGCCSGQVCDNNWGVSFGPTTPAYQLHVQQGLLTGIEPMPVPVHPFPLYMVMAYRIVYGKALWYSRRQFRPGQLASFTFMIYFISRFVLECWRDGTTNHSMGTRWIGLKTT